MVRRDHNGQLFIENLSVKELTQIYPTPFYAYSKKQIISNKISNSISYKGK